jgi:hypothetical protein
MTQSTLPENTDLYDSCGLKFAFDVGNGHVLNWYEYFGWADDYDMISTYLKENPISDETSLNCIDCTGAKFTIVFESACDPENYEREYNLAIAALNAINKNPNYNKNTDVFNNMLEHLNEDEENPVIFEKDPDSLVWTMFNKSAHGFETHIEHIAANKT